MTPIAAADPDVVLLLEHTIIAPGNLWAVIDVGILLLSILVNKEQLASIRLGHKYTCTVLAYGLYKLLNLLVTT